MVTEALMDWLASLVLSLWGAPSTDDPSLTLEQVNSAWDTMTDLNYFLPLAETFAAVAGVVALGPPMLATTIALWLGIGVIRGGSHRI